MELTAAPLWTEEPLIQPPGGDLLSPSPSVAVVCRWAARGAGPSCHLSGRAQFPSHQLSSRNEGVDGNDERHGDFNMTRDSAGVPVARGRNPTLELVVNTTAACSQPSNTRCSPVRHFSVMWGSADSLSRLGVCRWSEDAGGCQGQVETGALQPERSASF